MKHFQLSSRPYIALVERPEVETTPDDPVQVAIYAPGTVCYYWSDHWQRAATITYAFLVRTSEHWALAGEGCLGARTGFAGINPQPWRTALGQRHSLAGTGLGLDWREHTRREYWPLIPLMGMILQVEPGHDLLRRYLHRATHGKRPFTAGEKNTLKAILRERGGMAPTAGDQKLSAQELRRCHRVIKARRDLAFRLARLAALDLKAEDRATVESLQASNSRWCNGRMMSLTERQVALLASLEARYRKERAAAAETLAHALARDFGLEPPCR